MAKVAGSPLFVRRIFRSVSCRWRATLGPQKNVLGRPAGVLNCSKDGLILLLLCTPEAHRQEEEGAVAGLFLLLLLIRDTSALQQVARVTSLLAPTLLPPLPLNPPAVSKVVVVLPPLLLMLLLEVVMSLSTHRRSSGIRLNFRRTDGNNTDDGDGDDDEDVLQAIVELSHTSCSRYSIESNLDGGFEVGDAKKVSRPLS